MSDLYERTGPDPVEPPRPPAWLVLAILVLLVVTVWLASWLLWGRDAGATEVEAERWVSVHVELEPLPAPAAVRYDRDLYPHWIDLDGDCQDARVEAIVKVSILEALTEDGCMVGEVTLIDPYSLEPYSGSARRLDVDHVVPLAEAHRSGAATWTREKRRAFANDPDNLLPTLARLNRQKGDRDPAEWRPPAPEAWCSYAHRWSAIKARYNLTSDPAEAAALVELMATCLVSP